MGSHRVWLLALLAVSAGAAIAQETAWAICAKWLSDTAHSAPYLADEPLGIELVPELDTGPTPDTYTGWWLRLNCRLYGHTKSGDALLVTISQEGKELLKYRAPLQGFTPDPPESFRPDWGKNFEDVKLEPRAAGGLATVTGKVTCTFSYYDDDDEKTRELAVRMLDVVRPAAYDGSAGVHIWSYGLRQDDLLGSAYVWMRAPEQEGGPGKVALYAWVNRPEGWIKDLSYRIAVNGEKLDLPEKFSLESEPVVSIEQREDLWLKQTSERVNNDYNTYKIWFKWQLLWGPKNDRGWDGVVWLADHPGDWEVKIRAGGETIRTLRFKVDERGVVVQHPESDPATPGALKLGPGRVFTPVEFPEAVTFDDRFRPEALAAGVLYGRPWVSEACQAAVAKLPPAKSGARAWPWPDAKLPPGRK